MGKWANVRGDYAAFLHFVRIMEPELDIYAAGISFGAIQTLDQAMVSPHLLKGIVAMSVSTIPLELPGAVKIILRLFGGLFPRMKMPSQPQESFPGAEKLMGKTDLRYDPLCPTSSTFGNLKELLDRQNRLKDELKFITLPILHLQGLRDDIAKPDRSLTENCGSDDASYREFENSPHDLLAGPDHEQVIGVIVSWLNERVNKSLG
jgi:alpha-beta hydrolase superfamily lysophospholipase